jgi:D-tagatose-1,6-bisphosphate aldolase subunit GatZ/KbaZ
MGNEEKAMSCPLDNILTGQKAGQAVGIPSICSANPFVIEASMRHAAKAGRPVLIESTCNQVNQFGGYTGKTPQEFVAFANQIAWSCDFPPDQVIFGGDHLGPSPWQQEPAQQAMDKASRLVQEYVLAGNIKIHLDASMKCGDDAPDRALDKWLSARRTATLARVAESTHEQMDDTEGLRYVIGTEVPMPGGTQEYEETIAVTGTEDVAETIEITRQAFAEQELNAAWHRVIAVVVQPGVEYGDTTLFEYDRSKAQSLARFIEDCPHLVYEAHSTDYQTARALRQMVADHFAILKVGPALTFALREAVFALALIEEDWLQGKRGIHLSRVREALEQAMLANPNYWLKYYTGNARNQRLARQYSFSDRSRYYWPVPLVREALTNLLSNLSGQPLPLSLLSQYLPEQYRHIRSGLIANSPRPIILDHIEGVLADYGYACGYPSRS